MLITNRPHKLFSPFKAEQIARDMQANDPEWEYIVRHDPTGKGLSFIEVYDENREFVGRV